jgi:putative transcriptional regulator
METRNNTKLKENTSLRAGSILIAKSFWNEEIYRRSVILLLEHNSWKSTGVILNKRSNLSVYDALPELGHYAPLYYGGPMDKKTIWYLHSNPQIPNSLYLGNDLFLGGTYQYLLEMIDSGIVSLHEFHFCAGFVEWRPGDLERELDANKWWVSEISREDLFQLNAEELWRDKLLEEEHVYGLFNFYPDPSLN